MLEVMEYWMTKNSTISRWNDVELVEEYLLCIYRTVPDAMQNASISNLENVAIKLRQYLSDFPLIVYKQFLLSTFFYYYYFNNEFFCNQKVKLQKFLITM